MRDEGNLYAFARVGDRYDLSIWNEEYWQRLTSFLHLAAERDVIVQIELWDMWDLTRENWARHPFNPQNNVNHTAAQSGLLTEVPFAPAEEPTKHTFFHTVPGLENNARVLRYQEAFADVSQNTGGQIRDRQLQYRRLLQVRESLGKTPRPINNVKIYNDHFGGAPKFLRNVFAGLASTRFHRPVPWNGGTRGLGLSDDAQRILRSVRTFTEALNWFDLQPRPDLLSHDDGVYLMAQPGRQYALGFDGDGSVELDARALPGPSGLRWMNLHEGKWIDGSRVEPGRISLQTPGDGLWMALLTAR